MLSYRCSYVHNYLDACHELVMKYDFIVINFVVDLIIERNSAYTSITIFMKLYCTYVYITIICIQLAIIIATFSSIASHMYNSM